MAEKPTMGERLRELRRERGMTVRELAEKAGVSQSYIYAVEAGTRGSRLAKLIKIARALEVDLATLIQDEP
ncbi:XRE family transcriptional regulator [Kyrpidia spormannii]|uniref:XRE family transcriptional regulator n=1 Tax=Kyrpidia spormannii TaxID=2055160 RepID=A0A2K8N993_9BACL|nr:MULTISPECIES: helix-turn-helix transcriptional regulator [Kyrpidia]ATY85921.1 XRE family transcriptional regulator [Kyrpidia spormannii]MCL6576163.1 helix-turn-helix transcriptional regulator [Kyrpidia sp.]